MSVRRLAHAVRLSTAALGFLLLLAACGSTPPQSGPPAAPSLLSLEIPSNAFGAAFSGVTPAVPATATMPANYFVLPLLTTTSPIVRVVLRTPYPAELRMTATDVDRGGSAVTLPQVASGTAMPSTGAFQVVSVTPNNPATWVVVVRYPNSFQGSKLITTRISDVVGGAASTPLPFSMSFRGATVTVSIASENNDGRITSNPAGIDCPGTCRADFLTTTDVYLTQSVTHNQTQFTGWTGACIGGNTGNSCRLALLAPGAAIIPVNPTATANFRIHTNTAIPPASSACPAPPTVTGMRWVTQPNCGTIPTSQGATLGCNASGFFCCGVSGGTPTANCPGGNETAVTCSTSAIAGGPVNQLLIQPGGCYERAP